MKRLLCSAMAVTCSVVLLQAEKSRQFEIVGKVIWRDDSFVGMESATVSLQAMTAPLYLTARINEKNEFRFKGLEPGSYTLILRVPAAGSMRKNVEVGASRADGKGRVTTEFEFERRPRGSRFNSTSVGQLAIPESARREYQRGIRYLENKDIERAIRAFEKALEISPEFIGARNRLGTIAHQQGQYETAEFHYRAVLDQNGNSLAALINLGGVLLAQGRYEDCLQVNLRAAARRSEEPLVQAQLGYCYYHLGRLEESEQHLRRTKELEPGHFSFPELLLAEIYRARRDFESSARELEDFLRLHPDSERSVEVRTTLQSLQSLSGDRRP